MSKTVQQIKYQIDDLLREKENLIEKQIEDKINETVRVLEEIPAQNSSDLKRVLMMMARDVKHIARQ